MKKKVSFAIFLFALGAVVAGLIGWAASKEAYRNKKIEQEINSLKQEAEKIRQDNNILEEKIAYFQTPEFQERVAKEKLNLQKPDEQVVFVKPSIANEVKADEAESLENETQEIPVKNYRKWWDYFFKY